MNIVQQPQYNKTRRLSYSQLSFIIFAILVFLLLHVTGAVSADNSAVDFESFSPGNINGQDGWSMTGPFDVEVAANTYGYATFGSQSLRISNAITSGSFGNQTFSKALADEAGETTAENNGLSGGTRQSYFSASWDIASTVPGAEQPGLQVVASPDRGDGARMSWVQMADTPGGITIAFFDFQHQEPADCNYPGPSWRYTEVASGLDRAVPHNIKITMQFVDSINNDVVRIYVDGVLVHTGLSWEDYFRDCETNPTRTVDSILFRVAGTAVPATLGNGFLIDNFTTYSGPVSETFVEISPTTPNGWGFLEETLTGSGSFVSGPDTPPAGIGSAQLTVDSSGSELVGTASFSGAYLRNINALTYYTYRQSGPASQAPALQLNVDYDLTDGNNGWQGRLVYEPIYSGTSPTTGAWELWDALDSNAKWWASGAPGNSLCPQGPSCTWGDILTNFPNAGIHATLPGLGFKAGSGWTGGFTGNVDNFTIQVNGDITHFNFENTSCRNVTQATDHNMIQDAIDNANDNDVIQCNAGTYLENITIDKPITLMGAGSECSDSTQNTVIQKSANAPVVTLAASGTEANPLTLQDLCINPQNVFGINVPNASGTVSFVTLDNVHVVGTNETNDTENERGLVVGSTASLTDVVITDSTFDHLTYGWYFAKLVSLADTSNVARVAVTNTSFSHNDAKGIYVEKLSDATFSGGVVNNNGIHTEFWNARWNGGFDLNLKAGNYQNLTFDGMGFTNNGLGVRDGVAMMVKARDDGGSYGPNPATLTNVLIQNNTINGNERGVRFGEVGPTNAGPTNVTIANNTLANNVPTYAGVDGSAPGAVVLLTNGDATVKGNTMDNNPRVFSQSAGTLTAYANNITNFTDAGLTSAAGTVNGRHNWWGTHASQPTGVDNDSWEYRLGAGVSSWGEGALGSAGITAAGGSGTGVIVSHGRGLANVPFGKGNDPYASNMCSDYYDFFVLNANGDWMVTVPVDSDSSCDDTWTNGALYQFALSGRIPDTACINGACWNVPASVGSSGREVFVTVDAPTYLQGTPFVAGDNSPDSNDPTAVTLSSFSPVTGITWQITAVLFMVVFFLTGIIFRRRQS